MSRIGAITHSSHREEAVEPEVGDLEPPGTTVRRVQGVPLPPEMAWITFYGGIERFPRLSGGRVTTGHSARGHRRDKTASELDPAESMISTNPLR